MTFDTKFKWLCIFLCFGIYLILALSSLNEPFMADSVQFVWAAKNLNNDTGIKEIYGEDFGLWHPPLYIHLFAIIDKFFGLNPARARSIGIGCFFMSLILIYEICKKLFSKVKEPHILAGIACFLYSINPLAVRNSLTTDIDTSILNASLLFFAYFLVLNDVKFNTKNIFYGMFLFLFVLWTKLTTPFILAAALQVYLLIKNDKKNLVNSCVMFISAMVLFLISWKIYCLFYNVPFPALARHLLRIFFQIESKSSLLSLLIRMARTFFYFLLWFSPFWSAAFVFLAKDRLKEYLKNKQIILWDFIFIYSAFVFVFYLLTGGYSHGVLKYYYPLVAVLIILLASWGYNQFYNIRMHGKLFIFLVAIIAIYYVFAVRDPIYTSYYALKEAIIIPGLSKTNIAVKVLYQMFFLGLPLAPVFLLTRKIFKKEAFAIALIICAVSHNFAFDVVQAKADYLTVYCYGGKGTKEVIEFLRPIVGENDLIIAPNEIVLATGCNKFSIMAGMYKDLAGFIDSANKYRPKAVVYGICSGTIEQYQTVFYNPQVQAYLKKKFIPYEIGSYTVWIEKKIR